MRRRGVGRAGRPGLVGTVARTAVIAGTATAVSKGVSGKMNAKEQAAADEQAAAQPAPQPETAQQQPATDADAGSGDSVDLVAELQKLASLKEAGVLTDEEFAAAKAKLLG